MHRLLPPAFFLLCVLSMVALHLLAPIATWLHWPWRLAGLALLVSGLGLTVSQSRRFEREGINIQTFDPPTALVITGPFRRTRNPMYLGFALALLGISLMLGSVSSIAPVVLFVVVCDRVYIRFEEAEMERLHGERYRAYRSRVRRWL